LNWRVAAPDAAVSSENQGSGGRYHSSAANPSDSQQDEDGFAESRALRRAALGA
jgi:protein required for attachment to host cells